MDAILEAENNLRRVEMPLKSINQLATDFFNFFLSFLFALSHFSASFLF